MKSWTVDLKFLLFLLLPYNVMCVRLLLSLLLQHWNEYAKSRGKMIDRRSSQVILPFTFWEPVDPKTTSPKGLFEMRTYTLIPGTLIEWGQAW